MENQYFRYKGYQGTIEPQLDEGTLYGKVAFIRDLVTYRAENLSELETEFKQSVDGYLHDCLELQKTPDKPFRDIVNGSNNV